MSDSVLIAVIAATAAIVIAPMVLVAWVVVRRLDQPRREWGAVHGGYASSGKPGPLPQVEPGPAPGAVDADGDEEQVIEKPIPVVPENPPRWVKYQPREVRPARSCHCHDDLLVYGQWVCWWPQPDGSVLLFCERTIDRPSEAEPDWQRQGN